MCFNTRETPASDQDVWAEKFQLYLMDLDSDLDIHDGYLVAEDLTVLSDMADAHPEWVTDQHRDTLNELGYRIDDNNNVIEIGSPTDTQVADNVDPLFVAVGVLSASTQPDGPDESDDLVLTGSRILVDDPEDDPLDHVYLDVNEDNWLEAAYEDRTYVDFDDDWPI